MPVNGQHVVPRGGKWAVRRVGALKVTKYYDDREDAIRDGRARAIKQRGDLFIHGVDGLVHYRECYGDLVPEAIAAE